MEALEGCGWGSACERSRMLLARNGGESQDFILQLSRRCVALPAASGPSVMPPGRGRNSHREETECMNAWWSTFDMCFTLSFDLNVNMNRSLFLEKGLQMKVYLYWRSLHNIVLSPRWTHIVILSMCGQALSGCWIQPRLLCHQSAAWRGGKCQFQKDKETIGHRPH